jgi:tripartite-type tricarboxylate transporter receptor subunit TctC
MQLSFPRRTAWRLAAAACLAASAALAAAAEPYPTKPIFIKTAFPAGGPADASIRAASVVLQRALGQPLISENLPGANGSLAAMNVLKASADGYTLLGTTGTDFLVAPLTMAAAKYKLDNFRLIGVVGISAIVLVSSAAHAFKNVDELIDHAKKHTAKPLAIAHWGSGSTPHIVGADFQARTGTSFNEIPYKGAAPVLADIGGSQVDLTFIPLGGPVLGMIQSGKLKAIGLASDKRNPALPDVPTLNESRHLKNFEYSLWSAVLAPANTPEPVVARLTNAMNEWVSSPENATRIATNASRRLEPMSVQQAAAFLKSEHDKFNRVAKSLKLDPQ